eukprot:Rmarinus@m.28659
MNEGRSGPRDERSTLNLVIRILNDPADSPYAPFEADLAERQKTSHNQSPTSLKAIERVLGAIIQVIFIAQSVEKISSICDTAALVKSLRRYVCHGSRDIRVYTLRALRHLCRDSAVATDVYSSSVPLFLTRCFEKDKTSLTPGPDENANSVEFQKKMQMSEKLQALKLVRLLMRCKPSGMPSCIVSSLVSLSEGSDDKNFRSMCLETLRELAVRNPALVASCRGLDALVAALRTIGPPTSDSILFTLLLLLNEPSTRQYLDATLHVQMLLGDFTDAYASDSEPRQAVLLWARRVIVTALRSWTGLVTLFSGPAGMESVVRTLRLPNTSTAIKVAVLDMLDEIVQVAVPIERPDTFSMSVLPSGQKVMVPDGASIASVRRLSTVPLPSERFERTDSATSGVTMVSNRSMSLDGKTALDTLQGISSTSEWRSGHDLLNNFLAMILVTLHQCGLWEELVLLARDECAEEVQRKSVKLLSDILRLSDALLPPSLCAKLHSLPGLVNQAADFMLPPLERSRASKVLHTLHRSFFSFPEDEETDKPLTDSNAAVSRKLDELDDGIDDGPQEFRGNRRVSWARQRVETQMDDQAFNNLLIRTKVLEAKDYQRWNWDQILDIVFGPLTNERYLKLALKTKFVKRLISFLNPEKDQFSSLEFADDNMIYMRTACELLEALLRSDEGTEFLAASRMFKVLKKALQSEIEEGTSESERFFAPDRVRDTLTREYFALLGVLSAHPRGVALLESTKVFTSLIKLADFDLTGREDLFRLILTGLDYSTESQARILLQQSLRSRSKSVRYYATSHLRGLWREGVSNFQDWGVESLVTQLYDEDASMVGLALSILDEVCDDEDCLESLVQKRPALHLIGHDARTRQPRPGWQQATESAHHVLLKILSTEGGFSFLSELGWVVTELQRWQDGENTQFVTRVESSLVAALWSDCGTNSVGRGRGRSKSDGKGLSRISEEGDGESAPVQTDNDEGGNEGKQAILPLHFYGQLAQTKVGVGLLLESGHVARHVAIVRDESSSGIQRRASLWLVGQVGSTEIGFEAFELGGVLEYIISLAESAPVLSLRGTCVYVLGLFSRCETARAILERRGWYSPMALEATVAIPLNPLRFLKIPPYKYMGPWNVDDRCMLVSSADVRASNLPSMSTDLATAAAPAQEDKTWSDDEDDSNEGGTAQAGLSAATKDGIPAPIGGNDDGDANRGNAEEDPKPVDGTVPNEHLTRKKKKNRGGAPGRSGRASTHETVLENVCKLANVVVAREGKAALERLRTKRPDVFRTPSLYFDCLQLFNHIRFELRVRRFVHALFDEVDLSSPAFFDLCDAAHKIRLERSRSLVS